MHVHLPKPMHGWRAFIGEVGIIVLGVLIALAFGQLVDAWQWRDKVSHAEAAMRLELAEDDGPQAYGRVLIGQCLDMQLAKIRDGAGTAPADQLRQWTGSYAPPFRTWDSEAWKVVVASDTGSHMGSDRLIAWSSPYRILPGLTELNEQEAQLVVELRNDLPPPGDRSLSDIRSLRGTADLMSAFRSLQTLFTAAFRRGPRSRNASPKAACRRSCRRSGCGSGQKAPP